MAVAYGSKTGVTLTSLSLSGQNVTLPAGTTAGELLLVHFLYVASSGETNSFNVTGGSTLINTVMYDNASSWNFTGLKYIYATATHISNGYIVVTGSNSNPVTVRINVYRISGAVASISGAGADVDSDTTPTYGISVTPTIENNLLVFLAVMTGATSASGYSIATDNPTWTERTDENITDVGSDDFCMVAATADRSAKSATGDATITFSGGDDSYGIMVAVNPVVSVSTDVDVQVITSSVQQPTVTGGSNVTATVIETTLAVQDPVVTTAAPLWTNDTKPSTTWTNETKI
jgi:hypothetical protein